MRAKVALRLRTTVLVPSLLSVDYGLAMTTEAAQELFTRFAALPRVEQELPA